MGRIQTAIHCGTPDRVPLSLVLDTFACNTMGVKYSEFCADLDVAGQTMLAATEKLGDVDSVQWATYAPAVLGMLWLAPMKLPGRDLPEDSLWQLDEQVRIQAEDYDRIVEMGWGPWFGQYIGKYLGEAAAAGALLQQKAPRWVGEFMGRGYVVFSASTVDHPYEHLCGGRTIQEFTMDLFTRPDKVQAAMDVDHGREARADPADGASHRACRLLGRQLAYRAAVPLAEALGPLRVAVHEGAGRDRRRRGRHPDAALRRRLGPRDRAAARAAGAHLRARHRRGHRPLPRQEDPGRAHVPDGRRAAGHADARHHR